MNPVPLNRTVLVNRLSEIERDIAQLSKFQGMPVKEFTEGPHYAIAEHYLRRALEAIFDAGNHILSRFPLAPTERPESYKAIALALGRHGVVPKEFAEKTLKDMAGYRNRIVHFYDEITPEELHTIVQNNLNDLETFAGILKNVITDPKKIGLTIQ
ncbi:MAG: DUF86 domain-containing protein [Candidatus Omnitrophica bacterium]|nr:DUF86 domain-containing protein [Candidatus Omnitrophota bacterium]